MSSSVISVDEIVRALLAYLGDKAYFRQLSEEVVGLGFEECEALATCWQLGGDSAVGERLHAAIGDKFPDGFFFPDMWIRIPPGSPRLVHRIDGQTYERGVWYAVPKNNVSTLALLREPLHDGDPNGQQLFEVSKVPPTRSLKARKVR